MISGSPDRADRLAALEGEVLRLRHERDALASRVLELEQELAKNVVHSKAEPAATFEDSFRIEQSRAKRQRLPLSVALVELDRLQELRDRLGHGAGEDALAHLQSRLEQSLRPTDVVSRVDGLAFAVMLSATALEQALAALTRVLHEVSAAPMEGQGNEALSFSAGLVQWRTDEALGDLLTRASRALGQARRGGAARIVVG